MLLVFHCLSIIENGEKNSAYFLGLEKNRQYKNNIKQLFNEKNKIVHEDEDILKNMCNFYEKLYMSQSFNPFYEDFYKFLSIHNYLYLPSSAFFENQDSSLLLVEKMKLQCP